MLNPAPILNLSPYPRCRDMGTGSKFAAPVLSRSWLFVVQIPVTD